MIGHALTRRALTFLSQRAARREFPALVGLFAFLVTVTLTLPVEVLVVLGTLMCRQGWLRIGCSAALGSALASFGLFLAFRHLGWGWMLEHYPDLPTTRAWNDASRWLSDYGLLALFGLMAFPLTIPKVPALALASLYPLPPSAVFLAIWLGKVGKYTVYAFAAARFPHWFESLHIGLGRAQPGGLPATRHLCRPGQAMLASPWTDLHAMLRREDRSAGEGPSKGMQEQPSLF
jgi:hypothetical protein